MLTGSHSPEVELSSPESVAPAERASAVQKRQPTLTLIRYLIVGACNTLFGYGCFALFTLLLSSTLSYGYVIASLLANLLSITFAFFGYKWFVFKTHGNYFKEWARCVGVYATSMVLSATALPFVVGIIRRHPGHERDAPYIAGAIVLVFSVAFSFFGHRQFSFASSERVLPDSRYSR
jgi:putative flippase GtrA